MSGQGDDTQAATAAPGWYPDGHGNLRWWDGTAWGPIAPAAGQQPAPAPAGPRLTRAGRIILIVLAVLFVPGILISAIQGLMAEDEPQVEKQPTVVSVADGCQRMYDLMWTSVTQNPPLSDNELLPKFRGLRDAAMENDPMLASGLQEVLQARNAAEVSDAEMVIMRRCVFGGHITQEQMSALAEAARVAVQ